MDRQISEKNLLRFKSERTMKSVSQRKAFDDSGNIVPNLDMSKDVNKSFITHNPNKSLLNQSFQSNNLNKSYVSNVTGLKSDSKLK